VRIALVADIHGNLPALEAVLDDIAGERVDTIVCLGDVAAFGPLPGEVVARLRAVGCPVVLGDADAELFAPGPPPEDETLRRLRDIDAWTAARLEPGDRAYLTALPATLSIPLDGGTQLAYHGSPRSSKDRILATTSDDDLAAWFGTMSRWSLRAAIRISSCSGAIATPWWSILAASASSRAYVSRAYVSRAYVSRAYVTRWRSRNWCKNARHGR
jgi:predicted phosphodiesterase